MDDYAEGVRVGMHGRTQYGHVPKRETDHKSLGRLCPLRLLKDVETVITNRAILCSMHRHAVDVKTAEQMAIVRRKLGIVGR